MSARWLDVAAPGIVAHPMTATTARIVALVGVCVAFSILSPFFLSPDNLLNVMHNTVVVGIIAAPLTLLLVARQVDLSVGSAVAFSATTMAVVVGDRLLGSRSASWPPWLRPCSSRSSTPFVITKLRVNSIIATLGTLVAFRGLCQARGRGATSAVDGLRLPRPHPVRLLGLEIPVAVFILIAVLAFSGCIMSQTRYGRHMYGMGANPQGRAGGRDPRWSATSSSGSC